eukprot:CAMPEP_0168164522 /NCGR_PEP_ID=MMETSP0139_2-20121125/982_1 /TAXON_ID=44445 /ORGANISM="Pseudo-nitzschia australis, Strain 10249 10 AB" /LENGTH=958 /DNA_ID=CAMNT_0008081545 /DNA_START=277 /DNA_END=3153 /DNA_ORIENTATION=+
MSPRTKSCWGMLSLFLLNFSALMTTTESFVVVPPSSNINFNDGRQRSISMMSAITHGTQLFQSVVGSTTGGDDTNPMEFRSMPNIPLQSEHKYNVSLLVIDHYDSFTYNLVDMLAQLTVDPPVVVAKDAFEAATRGDISSFFEKFDGIILSPGPGTPQEQPSLSHLAISENPDVPILGVCLGHQLMSLAYGATVDRAPVPIHGQDHQIVQKNPWEILPNGNENFSGKAARSTTSRHPSLFQDLPSSFRVVRYHSLCAYDLPENLAVTAKSRDNVVQAIQHESNPHYGVQFHPESIGTENGMALLENFVQVVEQHKNSIVIGNDGNDLVRDETTEFKWSSQSPLSKTVVSDPDAKTSSRFRVMVHRLPSEFANVSPLRVFQKFYARKSHTIWLDSSSSNTGRGELDILAAPSRADDTIEYHIDENKENGEDILSRLEKELFDKGRHNVTPFNNIGWVEFEEDGDALEWVQENDDSHAGDLPFNYRGGFLGFLGYEVRHDTQQYLQQLEGGVFNEKAMGQTLKGKVNGDDDYHNRNRVPTAAFFLARQSMVYHHPTDMWYLIGLVEEDDDVEENLAWMKKVDADLKLVYNNGLAETQRTYSSSHSDQTNLSPIAFVPNRSKETYKDDVSKCHEYIKKGDSYELCLTNQLEATISGPKVSSFDLYKIIREVNPAPYSSYFRWNLSSNNLDQEKVADVPSSTSLAICSSSPERFMSVSRQQLHPEIPPFLQAEAKPIKGTCARVIPQNGVVLTDAETREDDRRARSLELSLKNRAENLMIVDLLRNDMSRVCETGSVHVSKLMDIESFATVHQMVSTIRGTLSDSCNLIDLLRASFPGGSMTGAPKIRTMEILQDLENNVDRGPYSGSLGYLSVNGCMDMNIMIRSATITPSEKKDEWKVSIGAGGAITAMSEAEDEYDEMLLKARAVKDAVQKWAYIIHDDRLISNAEAAVPDSTDTFVKT